MNKVHFIIVLLILCFPLTGRAQNTWANSEILPYDTVVTVTDYSRPVAVKDTLNEEELFDFKDIQLPPLSVFLESVEKHPTVRIYDAKREEAEAELKVIKRKWLDYLRITANYQYGQLFTPTTVSDDPSANYYAVGNTKNLYNIGVNLSIPLGDLIGGQRQNDYAITVENRKLIVLEAYNKVQQELAVLKAKAEAAALYNAQMKISEQDFINGKIDIISLSMERGRRSGALVAYESGRVALQNAITLLEMLTDVKIMKQ